AGVHAGIPRRRDVSELAVAQPLRARRQARQMSEVRQAPRVQAVRFFEVASAVDVRRVRISSALDGRDGFLQTAHVAAPVALTVPNVSHAALKPHITKRVPPSSTVYTDEYASYRGLKKQGYYDQRIHHAEKVYVRGDIHTNTVRGCGPS